MYLCRFFLKSVEILLNDKTMKLWKKSDTFIKKKIYICVRVFQLNIEKVTIVSVSHTYY